MNNTHLIITAYLWNFLSNLLIRGMGVISTLVLVRLLDSDDFGLVAIAMMVKGFFDVLSNVGINRYLILKTAPTDDDYHAAWTFNIALRSVLTVIFVATSGTIANYFENPALINVLYVLAFIFFTSSFMNVGLIKLEKEINFRAKNQIAISAKVVSFLVTVSLAFYYKSYVALVVGLTVNALTTLIASYVLCDFRPRLLFRVDRAMLSMSTFLFLRSLIGFARAQIDTFIVSKFFGKSATGDLNVSKQFATMPYTELVAPALSPIFSALSALKQDKPKLQTKTLQSLFLTFILIIPAAVGLSAVKYEFTEIVLGEKWLHIAEVLGLLTFLMIPFTLTPILHILFDAYNRIKVTILIELADLITFVALVFSYMPTTLIEFVYIRLVVSFGMLVITLLVAHFVANFEIGKFFLISCFLLGPNVLMYSVVSALDSAMNSIFFLLVIKVFIGALVYFAATFTLLYLQVHIAKISVINKMIPERIYNPIFKLRTSR